MDAAPDPDSVWCASDRAPTSSTELVICVHGTGASDDRDSGPHWWQGGSAFERAFRTAIPSSVILDRPFHWSGKNSERERRLAGTRLLHRLRALDAEGASYHLVGHSHGGSVIWHALVQSCGKAPLVGLRSWSTVGTPFLEFRPSRFNAIAFASALVSTILTVVVLVRLSLYLQMDGGAWLRQWSWLLPASLLLILILSVGAILVATATPIAALFRWRRLQSLQRTAAAQHRNSWLGLWHSSDESISGLAAALCDPQLLTPRLRPRSRWQIILAAPFFLYNSWIAAAGDQFIWRRLLRKAVGSDLAGLSLSAVSRSPAAIAACWPEMPCNIAARITQRCDAEAARSIASLRRLLGVAYESRDAGAMIGHLQMSLTWKELIHTSYFDDEDAVRLLAVHIRRHARTEDPGLSGADSVPLEWLKAGPLCDAPAFTATTGRWESLELRCVSAVAGIGLSAVLAVAILGSFQTLVAPYTDRFQVETIVALAPAEEVARTDFEVASDYNAALVALGHRERAELFVDTIEHPEQKGDALIRMSGMAALTGDNSGVPRWLAKAADNARSLGDGTGKTALFTDVGESLLQLERIDEAVAVLNEGAAGSDRSYWQNALDVAVSLDQAGQPDAAGRIKQRVVQEAELSAQTGNPTHFLRPMVEGGLTSAAVNLVARNPNPRGGLFRTICTVSVETTQEEGFFAAVLRLQDPRIRGLALFEATHAFIRAGRPQWASRALTEALRVSVKPLDASSRSAVLAMEMSRLADAENLDRAFVEASRESNLEIRDEALVTLVKSLSIQKRLEEASYAVTKLVSGATRTDALVDLSNAIADALDAKAARLTLGYAVPPVTIYQSFDQHREVMAGLLTALAAHGDLIDATNIVAESLVIQNDAGPVDVLTAVAIRLASLGFTREPKYLLDEASRRMKGVEVDRFNSRLRLSMAKALALLGDYRGARLHADRCSTTDRLIANTSILLTYSAARNPKLRHSLGSKAHAWAFVVEYD